jgi:3-hydroxyisobutyrate dehydrogenase-like beta-hydroxyacid dehydrogenase
MVPTMFSVLFIGKGIISTSLTKRLNNENWKVDYFRREKEHLETINLSKYDYVVSCLPDAEIASRAWSDILVSALNSNAYRTIFIDISTLTCEAAIKINDAFCREKLTFIEAPFTGSKTGALNGSLVYFACSDSTVPAADLFLKCTSSKIYNFSKAGAPTQFKLFYNLWGLTSLGLLGQMLQIMNSMPHKDLVAEIVTTNEDFWMATVAKQKLHQCLSQSYENIHCKLKYAKKDITYALNEFSNYRLDLSRCLLFILEESRKQQYDDLDFTSMYEFFSNE